MATNKKPRKKRNKNKGKKFVLWCDQEGIDYAKNMTNLLGLHVYTTLRAGTADGGIIAGISHAFNMIQIACRERKYISVEDRQAIVDCIEGGQDALKSACDRAEKRNSDRYVFSGDELKAIQDAADLAIDIINQTVEDGSINQLCREIEIMQKQTGSPDNIVMIRSTGAIQ